MLPSVWILLALAALIGYGLFTYNRFVALRQRSANAFSDIDVQLKRRWDLVPSLVETVRGYAGHEQQVLNEIVAARSRVVDSDSAASGPNQRGELEAGLAGALRGVFVLVEDYPALKADRNFLELHTGLVEIEDDLQNARRYYNAVIRDLNTLRQSQPAGLIGSLAGVRLGEFFQVDREERAVPVMNLSPASPNEQE